MQQYPKRIAGSLNAILLVTVVVRVLDWQGPISSQDVLFIMLSVLTPAFTLFALYAPAKEH